MKLLMYSFFVLLIAPCNSSKKLAKAEDPNTNKNSKVVISYQATPCFGRCALFTLTINGETKTATYLGTQNIEKIGTFTKPITEKELDALVKAFDDAKFTTLNDEYLGNITDFPIKIISYTVNGKTKQIKERSGAPEELIHLEKVLLDYANSEGWKKSDDSTNSKD